MKKKVGRPKKSAAQKKSVNIHVRLTKIEYKKMIENFGSPSKAVCFFLGKIG